MISTIPCGTRQLDFSGPPLVMGILNVTPDSFSDGGKHHHLDHAISVARQMINDGADIIDIGGESTRPFATPVSLSNEIGRTIPLIEALSDISIPISIDTTKAEVARAAISAGATIVNDISAMTLDPEMPGVVADTGVPVILMHMQGTPQTMQQDPTYADLVSDVIGYLQNACDMAMASGINTNKLIIDPGIGFGKTVDHNLALMSHLSEFQAMGFPVLVGTSRKSFIQSTIGYSWSENPAAVDIGTQATVCSAVLNGASILRVHDVAQTVTTTKMAYAIRETRQP